MFIRILKTVLKTIWKLCENSVSLKLASMSTNDTHIRVVVFQPGSEARGALGSIPIALSFYVTLSVSLPVSSRPFLWLPPTIRRLLLPTVLSRVASPHLFWCKYCPTLTTVLIPIIPAAVPPTGISLVFYESWCTGTRCSGRRSCMPPPPLSPPPTFPRIEAGITTVPLCPMLVSFPPYNSPPCSGILQVSSLS